MSAKKQALYARVDKDLAAEASRIAAAVKADVGLVREKTYEEIITLGVAAYLSKHPQYAKPSTIGNASTRGRRSK